MDDTLINSLKLVREALEVSKSEDVARDVARRKAINIVDAAIAANANPPAQQSELPPLPEPAGTVFNDGYWLLNRKGPWPYDGREPTRSDFFIPEQVREYALAAIRAANANQTTGEPVMPQEPTDDMQLAGAQAIRFDTTPLNKIWTANAVYRAMRAVAPQVSPVQADERAIRNAEKVGDQHIVNLRSEIQAAQAELATWPDERRKAVQLEGKG